MEHWAVGTERNMTTPTSLGDDTITIVIINDRREVSAHLDRVWDLVANVDNDPT